MNKPVFIIFISIFTFLSKGQTNYVYNGGFEEYDNCPTSVSTPSDLQINHCLGWTTPTYATSDFFNTCSIGFGVDVPNNSLGHQYALNGKGYCGFLGCSYDTLSDYQWWEYIQGKLSPLVEGKLYLLSINLNLAEDSFYWIDRIGVYLSSNGINNLTTTLPLTNVNPQFQTPKGIYINDTTNWMHFEWYFIASGTERYVTIGNFNDFYNSNAVLSPQGGTKGNSYLFIDDVSIIEATEFNNIPNIFTPNNDGINDLWIIPLNTTSNTKVKIVNRWGNLIYESDLNEFGWDGKNSSGKDCSDGVYYYIIDFGNKNELTGFIQLIR